MVRETAFHNELLQELLRMSGTDQSLTTAHSIEDNVIVERANQEVFRHLNAVLSTPESVIRVVAYGVKEDIDGCKTGSAYFK